MPLKAAAAGVRYGGSLGPASAVSRHSKAARLARLSSTQTDWLVRFDIRPQVSPVGTIAAVSTIKMMLFSGARVQCITPFGTTKPCSPVASRSKHLRIC
jgi:hypothetical protein